MKKKLVLGSIILYLILFPAKVLAQSMSFSPNSGNVNIGSNTTINIVAVNPSAGMDTVDIRIAIPSSIMSITSYTDGPDTFFSDGCVSGAKYNSSTICVTASKSGDYQNNDVIGSFTISGTTDGQGILQFTEGNAFWELNSSTPVTGNSGTFVVGAGGGPVITPGPEDISDNTGTVGGLPATALGDSNLKIQLGLILLICGVMLFLTFRYSFIELKNLPIPQKEDNTRKDFARKF